MPISEPDVTLQIIGAAQDVPTADQKVLIVGQMLTGSATAGQVSRNVGDSNLEINNLFGRRSHVAGVTRRFKVINKRTQLDVLPLADAGGAVDGTASVVFTGTATAAGRIFVSAGSQNLHRYAVDITVGQTAAQVATAVEALFDADADAPFTAATSTATVTFTAENGGTLSNFWAMRVEGSVAGISYTLNGWSGGATDPTLTNVLDAIGTERYQTILWPSNYDLTVVEALLNSRFNASNDILDGVACQIKQDTLNNLKTYFNQNSQSIWGTGDKAIDEDDRKGSMFFEMPDMRAADKCALRSLRLTPNAPLTQFLTTVAPGDQFGSDSLASLPYFNTLLPNVTPPLAADEWSLEDQDELRDAGVSVDGPNRAYNASVMGEQVTTYLTDNAGNADDSYKFLNYVDTISKVREYFAVNAKAKYAQTRLTDGDRLANRDMANEPSIRADFNGWYDDLARLALTQLGAEQATDFDENLNISLDVRAGTATVDCAPLLVTQLRAVLGTIAVNFGG